MIDMIFSTRVHFETVENPSTTQGWNLYLFDRITELKKYIKDKVHKYRCTINIFRGGVDIRFFLENLYGGHLFGIYV